MGFERTKLVGSLALFFFSFIYLIRLAFGTQTCHWLLSVEDICQLSLHIKPLQNQIVTIRALMSQHWIGHVSKASKWEFLNGTTSFYDRKKNLILRLHLDILFFVNLFYYSIYFCYYSWISLYFFALFMCPTIISTNFYLYLQYF